MARRVVIVGAGMGGLTAAIRLAQQGCHVTVVESRDQVGGLAASVDLDGFRFDAGPYVLLDLPGLQWAFAQLDMEAESLIRFQRISEVYSVTANNAAPVTIYGSLDRTADQFERRWPDSGRRYRHFIERMRSIYARLQPLQWVSRPGITELLQTGAWRHVPFLLRSLESTLASARLPQPVSEAMGIWTHVAGQSMAKAPSPLALTPAVIHTLGAYYPEGGIGAIVDVLFEAAKRLDVTFRLNTRVASIQCKRGAAVGVETVSGEFVPADAVLSNVGLASYLQILDDQGRSVIPQRARNKLDALPLQSPGVCVYLAVVGEPQPPYLKFHLRDAPDGCRLLITPGVLQPHNDQDGWRPARLIAPLRHSRAESADEEQQSFLEQVLEENWWRDQFQQTRVLATRTPNEWGAEFHLHRNSMNPVMTARFMRAGRLAHRSPWIDRLHLAGSATHPGQWVSFCAVSGVLAANQILQD